MRYEKVLYDMTTKKPYVHTQILLYIFVAPEENPFNFVISNLFYYDGLVQKKSLVQCPLATRIPYSRISRMFVNKKMA